MLLFVLIAVLVGAGTALSPCALPVLPALLSASATSGRARPLGVVLGLSATFLVTIAFTATVLEHIGLGGTALRWAGIVVLAIAGTAAIVPAAGRLLERPLASLGRLAPKRLGEGFGSGLLVGAALGFVYAPCAGPILAAVVAASAATGKTVAIALGYTAGTAAVLFAIALGGRHVLAPLRRAGPRRVQQALGAVLVLTAVILAIGLDTRFETALARHTPDITVTAGLERSGAVRHRIEELQGRSRSVPFPAGTAGLPVLGTAPDFTGTQRWFNTPGDRPLSLAALRGRVVLVDFWTYTCINCLRTLPYLEAWDARYRRDGLTIVGVHSPEFGFEHDAGNVRRAIAANGIRYPVAQDNDLATWDAWNNAYWPAEYLIDAQGRVRHASIGEGDYAGTEHAIRALLAERGDAVASGGRAASRRHAGLGPHDPGDLRRGRARAGVRRHAARPRHTSLPRARDAAAQPLRAGRDVDDRAAGGDGGCGRVDRRDRPRALRVPRAVAAEGRAGSGRRDARRRSPEPHRGDDPAALHARRASPQRHAPPPPRARAGDVGLRVHVRMIAVTRSRRARRATRAPRPAPPRAAPRTRGRGTARSR